MNLNGFLNDLGKELAEDTELSAWLNITYEKDLMVFMQESMEDPPSVDDCPLIVLDEIGSDVGPHVSEKQYFFGMYLVLADESKKQHTNNRIVEYNSKDHLKTFRDLVVRITKTTLAGNAEFADLSRIQEENDPSGGFPIFTKIMQCQINEAHLIGADPYE